MWISVAVPVAIFVLFTNFIVLTLIYRSRKLQTLRNVPLIGLATADMLVGALWIPLATAASYVPDNKILCRAALYFEILTMHASLFNLIGVSAERWIAIFRPLHYYQIATKSTVVASLTASWVLSFILLFAFLIADKYESEVTECDIVKYANIWFLFLISVIFYIVCGIMIIMQLKVYVVVRNQLRKIQPVRVQPNVPRGLIAATSFIVEESVNVVETADYKEANKSDQRRSIQSLNTASRSAYISPIKECPGASTSPKGVTKFIGPLHSQIDTNKCPGALGSPKWTTAMIYDSNHFDLNSKRNHRLEPIMANIDDRPEAKHRFRAKLARKSEHDKNVLSRAQTESKLEMRILRKKKRISAGSDNNFNSKSYLDQSKCNNSNEHPEYLGANKAVERIEDVPMVKNNFTNIGTRKISQRGVKNRAMLYSKREKTTQVDVKSPVKSNEFCNIVNLQEVEDEIRRETIMKMARLWRMRTKGKQNETEKQWINHAEIRIAKNTERDDDNNSDNGYQSISHERPSLADIFTASSLRRASNNHQNFTASGLGTESSSGPNFTASTLKRDSSIRQVDKATAKRAACYSIDERVRSRNRRPKTSFLAIARVFTTIKKQRRKEIARSIATNLVCLCFVVMWAPKSTVDLLTGLGYCQRCSLAHSISAVLAWTNSGINALIYAWRMPEFREAILACRISSTFKFKN